MASLCVRRDCGHRPRPARLGGTADDGPLVCPPCGSRVWAELRRLPVAYAESEASVVLPRSRPPLQRVSGTHARVGIVLDEDGMTTRSAILDFLVSWSALVADERGAGPPRVLHPQPLTAFLLKHVSWLLAHPATADFVEELAAVSARTSGSLQVSAEARRDIGRCVHRDCDATLSAPASRAPDGRGGRQIRCAAGHSWQPHQWLELHRRIRDAQ